jgi:hypothetical protein
MALLIGWVRSLLVIRGALVLENLALRQQLATYTRTCKRPRLRPADRFFWIWLSKLWRHWSTVLIIVKPQTVIGWHRQGWRLYWRRRRPVSERRRSARCVIPDCPSPLAENDPGMLAKNDPVWC